MASSARVSVGRLITASCTTGWADWIHGQLWLLPDGLLRVRSSLLTTIGNGVARTVSGELPTREFSEDEIAKLAKKHVTNYWIPSSSIVAASLRRGVTASRLSMRLADGRNVKLLWLPGDPAEGELRSALTSWGVEL
jgi:hypothetical protein